MIDNVKSTIAAILLCFCLLPSVVSASNFTVRPFLIDTTLEPRDVQTEIIKLVNHSETTKLTIYATVNEISVDTNGEIKQFVTPVMTDQKSTITSWVEITRGRIELPPGEEREVPITFRINPNAVPGEYHAFIGFSNVSNKPAAQAAAMAGEADGVIVKIVIADQREDSLHVAGFLVDRFVIGDQSRLVDISVENLGDLYSVPEGEIVFYDSRGVEITSTPVNLDATGVNPGDTIDLQALVPEISQPGRFKANLTLKYGENQRATLHDTTFFYVIPWHLLVLTLIAITAVTFIVFYLFRRVFIDEEFHDETGEVTMYVRDGHDAVPKDHDIDLKNNA